MLEAESWVRCRDAGHLAYKGVHQPLLRSLFGAPNAGLL